MKVVFFLGCFLVNSLVMADAHVASEFSPHAMVVEDEGLEALSNEELVGGAIVFGTVFVHQSVTRVVRLSSGALPLRGIRITYRGFEFLASTRCPVELPANSYCDIFVRFWPTRTGFHTGDLFIDAEGFNDRFGLYGTAR